MSAAFTPHLTRQRAVMMMLISISIWSLWVVISSYSVRSDLLATDITMLRFGTAALLLLPIVIKKGLRIGPWGIAGSFFLAMMMGAPYNIFTIYGMKFIPASHAAGIINTTMLILTTLIGVLMLGEHSSRTKIAGVCISIVGIALLFFAETDAPHAHALLGHGLVFAGGITWSLYAVFAKKWHIDPLHTAACVSFWSALVMLPLYVFVLPTQISMATMPQAVFQALYQGVLNSIAALICYNHAVRTLGASTSSAFLPLIPVIATLLAIPALGEVPMMQEWLGIALAAIGVLLATGAFSQWLRRA